MKVLRIIARLNVGGPARHVVWLTDALNDGEFESVLIAGTVPPTEEDMGYFADDHGVRPVFIEEMSRELSPQDALLYPQAKLVGRWAPAPRAAASAPRLRRPPGKSVMAVICSSDGVYAESGPSAAAALKAAGARRVYVAGQPGDLADAWREAGVDEFVHVGVDVLAVLRTAHEIEEAASGRTTRRPSAD